MPTKQEIIAQQQRVLANGFLEHADTPEAPPSRFSFTPLEAYGIHPNARGNLESAIRSVDTTLDPIDVWPRVETWLTFWDSYKSKPPREIPTTKLVIESARLWAAGFGYGVLADAVNMHIGSDSSAISPPAIKNTAIVVQRALAAVLTDEEKSHIKFPDIQLTADELRIRVLYETYTHIPQLLTDIAVKDKHFAMKLKQNPHVVYVFERLSKGEHLGEIMQSLKVPTKSRRENASAGKLDDTIVQTSEHLQDMFLSGTLPRSHYGIFRQIALAPLAFQLGDWYGRDPAEKIATAAIRLLTPQRHDIVTLFLELVPTLEYYWGKQHYGLVFINGQHVVERFPGFRLKDHTLVRVSDRQAALAYWKRIQENQSMPEILPIIARAAIHPKTNEVLMETLREIGRRDSPESLINLINGGWRFLEAVSLTRKKIITTARLPQLEDIFRRSSRSHMQYILRRIAKEVQDRAVDKIPKTPR